MEQNENKSLPFGRKLRVGNYWVLKYTRSINRKDLRALRDEAGIPRDVQKHLQRGGLPYIKVEAVSGIWSVEFMVGTSVYRMIDEQLCEDTMTNFVHIFTTWFTDTAVRGDEKYIEDKAAAMAAYMERIKATKGDAETAEEKAEDDKVLDDVKADEEAKATVADMVKTVNDIKD